MECMKVVAIALLLAWNAAPIPARSCFLLYEVGKGEVRRRPADLCTTRLLPASTFKIPHALAALDAGVVSGPGELMKYDGAPTTMDAWRHDHTLQTAMRDSVVWYFQRIAERLGLERERQYLRKFEYGNADPSSGLTTFWLGGSLQITPEEQVRFMRRLYRDELPVSPAAMRIVRQLIVQPQGAVVNATGQHPFAAPWPPGTTVGAKTGSGTDRGGQSVRWLVGHVARGERSWVFVSCVAGGDDIPALAAVDRAAAALREEGCCASYPSAWIAAHPCPPDRQNPVDHQCVGMLNRRIHTVDAALFRPSSNPGFGGGRRCAGSLLVVW
jgi:beta-lactamase class D